MQAAHPPAQGCIPVEDATEVAQFCGVVKEETADEEFRPELSPSFACSDDGLDRVGYLFVIAIHVTRYYSPSSLRSSFSV